MIIEVTAKFPIEWDKDYYRIGCETKRVFAPCDVCDSTGKVAIKGAEYPCPACKGDWREKKVVGQIRVYHIRKYRLKSVEAGQRGATLQLEQKNSKNAYPDTIRIRQGDFDTMIPYGGSVDKEPLTDDYKAAMAEVKRRNAEEKRAAV